MRPCVLVGVEIGRMMTIMTTMTMILRYQHCHQIKIKEEFMKKNQIRKKVLASVISAAMILNLTPALAFAGENGAAAIPAVQQQEAHTCNPSTQKVEAGRQ